jgi:uncharacterized protein with PIN domain
MIRFRSSRQTGGHGTGATKFGISLPFLLILLAFAAPLTAQDNADCYACHDDRGLRGTRKGRPVSMYVDSRILQRSVHGSFDCSACHTDTDPDDLPHADDLARVDCSTCHSDVADKQARSLHGKAARRGDALAPNCVTCHGSHNILSRNDPKSPVRPFNVPFLCGSCHREGTPVTRQRVIDQDNILENYSESLHGEGLLKKGLIVSATCVSCHTAHEMLPHEDPASSIARKNIANTCAQCHTQIEQVHRKVIKGELWEKQAHLLPACVDCHQPHKIRNVFYDQGMADKQCLSCHEKATLRDKHGKSMYVDYAVIGKSRHKTISCSQCHSGVNQSHKRPCDTITQRVDCSSCHPTEGDHFERSIHGIQLAAGNPNSPGCLDCHGTHGILGKRDPKSLTFPTRVPQLCAECHQTGREGATRASNKGEVVGFYVESIHGKGLLQSGLVVTAQCTDCHTAHQIQKSDHLESSVHANNVATTCGTCHHGIEEQFNESIHSRLVTKTDKELPTCNDCHSAHTIRRADTEGFKLKIMSKCGRCHERIAETYFDTYHGKVSRLGYTKTAKCYDCHGSHDILPVSNPKSRLSHGNVVQTCQKCHPGANRRFAGYLTHATHHDPDKYPYLFWAFWGMTSLLILTFLVGGTHTFLWLPRALQWRRQLRQMEAEGMHEEVLREVLADMKQPPDASDAAPDSEPRQINDDKEITPPSDDNVSGDNHKEDN